MWLQDLREELVAAVEKKMRTFATLLFAALSCALSGFAQADNLTSGEMVKQLQPKAMLTRSLTGTASAGSPEDQTFLRNLQGTTRAIVVEDREKLAEIVQKYEMPKFDLEIYFDFNSAKTTEAAMPTLIKLGQALTDPSLAQQRIIISGHTDAVGSDVANQQLSEERAEAVKDFLVKNFEVDPQRLIAVGYGEEQLKNGQEPEAGENRRVTVVNIVM